MARKSMSLLDLKAWLHHNQDTLQGARISNIYYDHTSQRLLLKIRPPAGGEERLLVAEPGKRVHYTTRIKPPQDYKPHPLVVTARKHMRGARLDAAEILGGDRILALNAHTGYTLVIELLPRGVALLLDPHSRIVAATRYEKFKDRTVRPKEEYKPPPPPNVDPLNLDPSTLAGLLGGQKDLVRGLVRAAKLPGEYAEEAIHRAGLTPGAKPDTLSPGDMERLVEAIQGLWRESLQGKGYLAPARGEATPFKPTRLQEGEVVEYPSFDEALDELYSTPREVQVEEGERARLLRSLEEARETARRYMEEAERLRRAASLIPASYDSVRELLECAARGRECPGVDRGRGVVRVKVDGEEVEARIGETVDQLILRLFRQAGELEAKARRAREAERSILERLEDLELKARARRAAAMARARRRQWYERYHWTITRGGLVAVGGRDAGQNEAVVKRYLGEGDIFMHADIHGAPAVVLKTGGREPSPEDLWDAATIAAAYSRAWRAGLGHVQVYWVRSGQVSKSPPTGEYLARGGFIVRGKKNYLPPVPTRLYLGLALDSDGAPMVVVGSREAVEERSLAYVELEPGDVKVEEAARRIKQDLAKALPGEVRHLALGLPEEEIQQRLPGKVRILTARRGAALKRTQEAGTRKPGS